MEKVAMKKKNEKKESNKNHEQEGSRGQTVGSCGKGGAVQQAKYLEAQILRQPLHP